MRIEDALAKFITQLEADGRSEHTIGQYRRHLTLLGSWLARERAGVELEQIDHGGVAAFMNSATARLRADDGDPKKANTLNALRTSLRMFFSYLSATGTAPTNAARMLRRALVSRPPPRAILQDDVTRVLDVMHNAKGTTARRDHSLFSLLAATGARVSAVLAVDVNDVDLDRGEILLRHCKAGREEILYVPTRVRGELARFIAGRTIGPLFAGPSGRALSRRHAHRRLQLWLSRAGIAKRFSPHSLRHGFAVRMYARTHDLLLVQAALHHRSILSTAIYAACDDQRLRQVLG